MKLTIDRFLWVSLQIENLCDSHRIKIEGDLVDELARMPRSLSDMYSLILKNIAEIEQHGRVLAETMLKWLLCTHDASLSTTIAACSGIEPTEHRDLSIPDILDVCSTLVTYDEALGSFRFAHLSVREFLESQQGYSPSETNRFVLEKSLNTIISNQPSGGVFSSYATFHWVFHYNRLEEERRRDFFEVHGKDFLFDGAEPSDAYTKWATELNSGDAIWEENSSVSSSIELYEFFQFSERFQVGTEPVDLASYFGWLEILDHFEANQTPNKFCGSTLTMMRIAIYRGQTSVLRWLFDRKTYPKDEHLELAFNIGESEIVQEIIEAHGPKPYMMTMAICYGRTSVLRWLFDRKFYPVNEDIELAFEIGHPEVVQQVIEAHGPTLKTMTMAIRYGRTSVLRWLFDRKFYPLNEHLELAFEIGQSEIVQQVMEAHALSLNTLVNGQNLLAQDCRLNLGDMYRDQVGKRDNKDWRDQNGCTLLSPTALNSTSGNSNIVKYLLLAGIKLIAQGYSRGTLLLLWILGEYYPHDFPASRSCKGVLGYAFKSYYYLTDCLLSHYRIDSILEDVGTRAQRTNVLQLIATLPDLPNYAPASPTERLRTMADDPGGQTLLSLASLFRHEKAFQVLLDLGSDPTCPAICDVQKEVSAVDQVGRSLSRQEPWDQERGSIDQRMSDQLRQGPLAWAAYSGNLPLAQSILDRGFNPNMRNRKGQTALYFAVQQTEEKYSRIDLETDKVSIVELLLQKGALLTSADANGGATLVAHALKARYGKVARLLIHSGVELPKGALTEGLWGIIDQGEEGIRQALQERVQDARVGLPQVQWPHSGFGWSEDNLNIAARLIRGGMMRVLGDAVQQYE